jgi:NADPH-dependent curcumin reductase CurA
VPESLLGREVRLAKRASGRVSVDEFVLANVAVPEPEPGQVLVRNSYFSLEPALRVSIDDSFGTPIVTEGQTLSATAVGEVVASSTEGFKPGQLALHRLGWREYAVGDAASFEALPPDVLPSPSYYLAPGLTAFIGMELADIQPGETVLVSSAAGAVGSLAGQMARLMGAGRVIGSAGSAAKVAMITNELDFDAGFDYSQGHVPDQLRAAAPDGIDVFFDNVGGEQLNASLGIMNRKGRIMVCGWLGSQIAGHPAPVTPFNEMQLIAKGLRIIGFNTRDYPDRRPDYLARFGDWLRSGKIRVVETVVDGLDAAPQAFCDMLSGRYTGRVTVRLA